MCEKLHNWNGYDVEACIEEKPEDCRMIIKYTDHGDEFIVVSTKSGDIFEYGWFCGRGNFGVDYADVESGKVNYLRNPKLYRQENGRAVFSNEICWLIDRYIYDYRFFKYYKKSDSMCKTYVRIVLDRLNEEFEKPSGRYFSKLDEKSKILGYLEFNGIPKDDPIYEEVENANWHSYRKDGLFDGIAGKRKCGGYIIGDTIDSVLLNGKSVPWYALKGVKHFRPDEWGVSQFQVKIY